MPVELTLASAFLLGLLGSTHCIGMCGGIVGALTLGIKGAPARPWWSLAPYLVAYNIGRIASYAAAGALLGVISAQMFDAMPAPTARLVTRVITSGFMIALGLYLTGWWAGLGALERLGGRLWKRIEPLGRRLLPVRNPMQALLLGLLWGWLPCGMVYAALAWSLASGSATDGALLMLAFGAGTLPMLIALGGAARWFGAMVRLPWVRRTAGILVLAFGAYALLPSGPHQPHGHATHAALAGNVLAGLPGLHE